MFAEGVQRPKTRQAEELTRGVEDVLAATTRLRPSVPVMTGTHFHALDDKGRVIIPAKLRSALTEQFWMMLNPDDNVALYDYQTGLDVLAFCERAIAAHPQDEDLAFAVERTTGTADLATVEGGWRVAVPEMLRLLAGLDKDIVTVGVLNHAVLWNRAKWEDEQARRLQSSAVRRAQASILRAAASAPRQGATSERETSDAPQRGRDDDQSASDTTPPATSAGDGTRGIGVHDLRRLGRR